MNHNPVDQPQARLVPPTIAEEATQKIGVDLFRQWMDYKYALGETTVFGGTGGGGSVPLGFNCFPQETTGMGGGDEYEGQEYDEPIVGGVICSMDHTSPGFSFQILTTVYRAEGSMEEYGFPVRESYNTDETNSAQIERDDSSTTEEEDDIGEVPVAVRMDITISAKTISDEGASYARDALVELIPVITNTLHAVSHPVGPIWSINERPSQRHVFASRRGGGTQQQNQPSTKPGPASLETMVLSNSDAFLRIPVISSSQKVLRKPSASLDDDESDSTDSSSVTTNNNTDKNNNGNTVRDDVHPTFDIWHTQETETTSSSRTLYLNSTLRLTTTDTQNAHSEAFVHPALVTHTASQRVLLISEMPLGHVKELMKYRSVNHVSAVGADVRAVEMARSYMPSLDDCGGIEGRSASCMDDESVEMVIRDKDMEGGSGEEGVDLWIDGMVAQLEEGIDDEEEDECDLLDEKEETYSCAEHPYFDVILLDISGDRSNRWLSNDFHLKLRRLMTDNSILVVNYGSFPVSLDGRNYYDASARDMFLTSTTKAEDEGGLGYENVHAYDEPLAAPLDNTYIILFPSDKTYVSFVGKNPTGSELDFLYRMRPQSTQRTPTRYYDGYSHTKYNTPTRAWENWFCESETSPGKDHYACNTFLFDWYNSSNHNYSTQVNSDPIKGRSLHASHDISKGSYVLPHDSYFSLGLDNNQWKELEYFVEMNPDAQMFTDLRDFFVAYGFEVDEYGTTGRSVSFTNQTFTNHACTKESALVRPIDELYYDGDGEYVIFSPILQRRARTINHLIVTVRDVMAQEEILMDYSVFRFDDDEYAALLQQMCQTGVGLVPVKEEMEVN